MAHRALDKILDELEGQGEGRPTLRDLSERLMVSRLELLATCLETALKRQYAADLQQREALCECGQRVRTWRSDPKEISTLHGRITLIRPYFYCRACGRRFHPVDTKLQLADGIHQFDIQERTTSLGAEMPFELSETQWVRLFCNLPQLP